MHSPLYFNSFLRKQERSYFLEVVARAWYYVDLQGWLCRGLLLQGRDLVFLLLWDIIIITWRFLCILDALEVRAEVSAILPLTMFF